MTLCDDEVTRWQVDAVPFFTSLVLDFCMILTDDVDSSLSSATVPICCTELKKDVVMSYEYFVSFSIPSYCLIPKSGISTFKE